MKSVENPMLEELGKARDLCKLPLKYWHLVRGPNDPEGKETPRGDPAKTVDWQRLKRLPEPEQRQRIRDLLKDGKAYTFNGVSLELCGKTADVMMGSTLENALFALLGEGWVVYSLTVPIYFSKGEQDDGSRTSL